MHLGRRAIEDRKKVLTVSLQLLVAYAGHGKHRFKGCRLLRGQCVQRSIVENHIGWHLRCLSQLAPFGLERRQQRFILLSHRPDRRAAFFGGGFDRVVAQLNLPLAPQDWPRGLRHHQGAHPGGVRADQVAAHHLPEDRLPLGFGILRSDPESWQIFVMPTGDLLRFRTEQKRR